MTSAEFYGTNATTSNESDPGATNVKTLEEVIQSLRSAPKKDQWLLVGPDGIAYKGNIESIMRVIVQNHPIFNEKFSQNVMDGVSGS